MSNESNVSVGQGEDNVRGRGSADQAPAGGADTRRGDVQHGRGWSTADTLEEEVTEQDGESVAGDEGDDGGDSNRSAGVNMRSLKEAERVSSSHGRAQPEEDEDDGDGAGVDSPILLKESRAVKSLTHVQRITLNFDGLILERRLLMLVDARVASVGSS